MKLSFSFIFVLTSILAFGQNNIPNPNFEQWTGNDPVGWQTSNSFTQQFGVISVSKESQNPYEGSFSVKLETKSVFGYSIAGIITNGQITINANQNPPVTILGGTPFTARPLKFKGYYKYLPASADTAAVAALLLKYNPITQMSDTIGFVQHKISQQATNWTLFDASFTYISAQTPDTIQVIAISSNPYASVVGSTLILDSLHFEGNSSEIIYVFNRDKLNVTYNANNKEIIIQLPSINQLSSLSIYDSKGVLKYNAIVNKNQSQLIIPAYNFNKGLYLINILGGNNYASKVLVY
jgi:hypothetical protein